MNKVMAGLHQYQFEVYRNPEVGAAKRRAARSAMQAIRPQLLAPACICSHAKRLAAARLTPQPCMLQAGGQAVRAEEEEQGGQGGGAGGAAGGACPQGTARGARSVRRDPAAVACVHGGGVCSLAPKAAAARTMTDTRGAQV